MECKGEWCAALKAGMLGLFLLFLGTPFASAAKPTLCQAQGYWKAAAVLSSEGAAPAQPFLEGTPQALAQFSLLDPIPLPVIETLKAQSASEKERRLQIGLYRPFSRPLVIDRSTTSANQWVTASNGWRVLTVQAASAGARGLRLHFENVRLPSGARFVLHSPASSGGPSIQLDTQAFNTSGEIWAPTVFADEAAVECQVPPGTDPAAVSFTISGLSHLYSLPERTGTLKEGACEIDVSCYPDYAKEAAGVALISYVHNGNSYLCSGALLATTYRTKAEYFLAARHCIGNQELASTIEFVWLFQTDSCNGTPPSPDSVPHTTGGADLVLAGVSDFALLKLHQPAPPGVFYLGWSVTPPAAGETLACIHHPDGTHKRISFGGLVGADIYFWGVQWNSGVTEGGSSGAPLLNAAHQVIGQLGGGFGGAGSSCDDPTAPDQFGRFDVTYTFIRKWIDPSGSGGGPPPVSASYYGLFYDQAGIIPDDSGAFTITTNPKGKFTGKLQMGSTMFPFGGQLDANGVGNATIKRLNKATLTMQFQIDLGQGADALNGLITDGNWTAQMTGGRPVLNSKTNAAPQAGKYTLLVTADTAFGPAGNSIGTVWVSKTGRLTFIGALADGTRAMQSTYVSANGQWALYIPLYGGQGFLFSQVAFQNTDTTDLSGALAWFNGGNNGFNFTTSLGGSAYHPPRPAAGNAILNFTNAVVSLSSSAWGTSVDGQVLLSPKGRMMGQAGFKASGGFAAKNGLLTGTVADPAGKGGLSLHGVALQKQNIAAGFFTGHNQTGSFLLQAAPPPETTTTTTP